MKKLRCLEYAEADSRNAILFNIENTEYLKVKLKEATENPNLRQKLYTEIANKFALTAQR
ncbi:MAG: hypothetical protein QMD21_04535 [Candidatus Thermoplasmatota archaeon]|nr:hypothetical protein [Candidatus Thermoplasmatota archaeon]